MFERTKFIWEVKLQPPSGETITWTVKSHWSPSFEGVKESVAFAARFGAWIKNKRKVEFQVIGEPKLVTA